MPVLAATWSIEKRAMFVFLQIGAKSHTLVVSYPMSPIACIGVAINSTIIPLAILLIAL